MDGRTVDLSGLERFRDETTARIDEWKVERQITFNPTLKFCFFFLFYLPM